LAKAKDPEFGHLFFSNTVTQVTRVCIEILRAIAKKLTTESKAAYVHGFTSRPILHYVIKDLMPSNCAGTGCGYSFADAVSRYMDLLCQVDLASAYRRAGSTFQGAMEHYSGSPRTAWTTCPLGHGAYTSEVGIMVLCLSTLKAGKGLPDFPLRPHPRSGPAWVKSTRFYEKKKKKTLIALADLLKFIFYVLPPLI
jgi:hypothetical protein